MAKKTDTLIPPVPRGNNPLADRFNHLPPKKDGSFPRVAYVLQGGGSLGAYQMGVVKGLLEAGYEPDWMAATSIGAIQSAIIVGNHPDKRIEKLDEFWQRIAPGSMFDPLAHAQATQDLYNQIGASLALMMGQPHFFFPKVYAGMLKYFGDPTSLSYYDTTPLRETLLDLIDFDLLNSCPIRLSLGAVQIRTGHLIYFNNINYKIDVEHVMASAALPPGFPAIEVDGEMYWDGGVHSNSPLEVILEANPPDNTLCFLVDAFGGAPFLPRTMAEIEERVKDISYGTHAERTIYNYLQRQHMRQSMQVLREGLPPAQRKKFAKELDIGIPHNCTLVHMIYGDRLVRAASKDYNFGHEIIQQREACGYRDAKAVLKNQAEWGVMPTDGKSRLFESPNNKTGLLRKKINQSS